MENNKKEYYLSVVSKKKNIARSSFKKTSEDFFLNAAAMQT